VVRITFCLVLSGSKAGRRAASEGVQSGCNKVIWISSILSMAASANRVCAGGASAPPVVGFFDMGSDSPDFVL
jgi:hypothetical protein